MDLYIKAFHIYKNGNFESALPGIKLLLGKQDLCKTPILGYKGIWKIYKGNFDKILFQPYLFIGKKLTDTNYLFEGPPWCIDIKY